MSKSVKAVVITAAIIAQVEAVLQDKSHNKYSTSRIYAAHNAVFGLNETPQSCASCLTKRARALEDWYNKRDKAGDNPNVSEADKAKIENFETFMIIDGERFTVVDDENEQPATVIFTPASEGANFGKATDTKGQPAPAYVYEQNGKAYLVQGDEGNYTDVTGEPIAQVNDFDIIDTINKKGEAVKVKLVRGIDGDKATQADGKSLSAGTYTLDNGDTIAVQPGGKATYKSSIL